MPHHFYILPLTALSSPSQSALQSSTRVKIAKYRHSGVSFPLKIFNSLQVLERTKSLAEPKKTLLTFQALFRTCSPPSLCFSLSDFLFVIPNCKFNVFFKHLFVIPKRKVPVSTLSEYLPKPVPLFICPFSLLYQAMSIYPLELRHHVLITRVITNYIQQDQISLVTCLPLPILFIQTPHSVTFTRVSWKTLYLSKKKNMSR